MFYLVIDVMIVLALGYVVRTLLKENAKLRTRISELENKPECVLQGSRSITGVITLFHRGRREAARAIFDVDRM